MHDSHPHPHHKRVIQRDLKIVHRLATGHNSPATHDARLPIRLHDVQAQGDLPNRQEAFLHRQEGVLFVGVNDFRNGLGRLALLDGVGEGEINQVVVVADPDMQDRLEFHLLGRGIVGPDLLTGLEGADGLLSGSGGDDGSGDEAEACSAVGEGIFSHMFEQIGSYVLTNRQSTHRLAYASEHQHVAGCVDTQIEARPSFVVPGSTGAEDGVDVLDH